jgi:transposase-like protein
MTYHKDFTLPTELLEQITSEGLDFLPELIEVLINTAMKAERSKHLKADLYERSDQRKGYANGYKPKTVKTRIGDLAFDVPQVRDGSFYPGALEKGLRSERALTMTLAEMYVQGVSTRKVKTIIEKLCGSSVSSTQVSKATAKLDETLEAWRNRSLGIFRYLYIDARYEKVRQNGHIQDAAVLLASGVGADGRRAILGVSVSLGEHEVHWRSFMQSLVERGLRGVELIISDDHLGLKAARKAVFGGIPWQRCQFHLQQNAQAYVPRVSMKAEVAEDLRRIFNAPNRSMAEMVLADTIRKYEKAAPRLSHWMEHNVPEGLTVFSFPARHQRRIRTTNMLERLNREIKRRTRVVTIFPNESSCLRLISAFLMEKSEKWQTGRKYLVFEGAD